VLRGVGIDTVNMPPRNRVIPVPCHIPEYGTTDQELRALELQARRPTFERVYNPDTSRLGALWKMAGGSNDRRPTSSYSQAETNYFRNVWSRVHQSKYMQPIDPKLTKNQPNAFY
jgi:hypothetical protein